MDDIIRGPGSPISPKSIFAISKFQDQDASHLATKFPSMHKTPPAPLGTTAPESEECKQPEIPFQESSPSYRRFKAWASDVNPILSTVLPIAPTIGERVYKSTMDDILVHNLGLQQADGDVFVGSMLGRRVVVTRMSPNEFGMFCTDEAQSKEFLMTLRSMNVHVDPM